METRVVTLHPSSTHSMNTAFRHTLLLLLLATFSPLGFSAGSDAFSAANSPPLPSLQARSIKEWEAARKDLISRMESVMGPLPGLEKRCPLDLQILNETNAGNFVRREISYQSEPGGRVRAYLLIPKKVLDGKTRTPGILTLHQTHALGAKVVVGLGNRSEDEYAVELANRGFVCLAPPYPLLADYHPDLKKLGYESGTMKAIWDNIRGLDLLDSLPFIEKGKFGAIGHSLGGHNSIYTAVFDPRIRVIVSSCGFDSYRHYMDGNLKGWTGERYMPRLARYSSSEVPFDFHEMVAALAPRHFLVNAPTGDANFRWWSVDQVAAQAGRIYALYGARNRLVVFHPAAAHSFPREMREQAYQMIESALKQP